MIQNSKKSETIHTILKNFGVVYSHIRIRLISSIQTDIIEFYDKRKCKNNIFLWKDWSSKTNRDYDIAIRKIAKNKQKFSCL